MKSLRFPDDIKSQYKKPGKNESELQQILPAFEQKFMTGNEKITERDDSQPLQARKPSSKFYTERVIFSIDLQDNLSKISKPLHSVAKESIFGLANMPIPPNISERERRIMLRDAERKKRISGPTLIDSGPYGHLLTAGANIAFQHEPEVDPKIHIPPIQEKNIQAPNAYFPPDFPKAPSPQNTKLDEDKKTDVCKPDDYIRYIQEKKKQAKESSPSLPIVGVPNIACGSSPEEASENKKLVLPNNTSETFARFKKKEIDGESLEKREKQRLLMQAELNRQIEEKQKRKMLEKQIEKETAEKDEQRIKKEQAELAQKRKNEEKTSSGIDRIKSKIVPPNPKVNPFEKNPNDDKNPFNHMIKAYNNSSSRSKFPSSNLNTNTRIEPEIEQMNQPSLIVKPVVPARLEPISEKPSIPLPPVNMGSIQQPAISQKILEDYQKQIESLKNEKQAAKEEALAYKEQLLREREMQLQMMMAKIQPLVPINSQQVQIPLQMPLQPLIPIQISQGIRPIQQIKPIIETNPHIIKPKQLEKLQALVRPETKETCEESLESSTRRLPTRSSNNNNETRNEVTAIAESANMSDELDMLEQSLSSNTKLVAVSEPGPGLSDDMYKTWKPHDLPKSFAGKSQPLKEANLKKVEEAAIQTSQIPKSPKKPTITEQKLNTDLAKNTKKQDESIFFDIFINLQKLKRITNKHLLKATMKIMKKRSQMRKISVRGKVMCFLSLAKIQ